MLRYSLFGLLGLLLLMPSTPAQADWHTFWNRVHLDWHRNNCWPEPFQTVDRRTVCETLSAQIANGWRRQNTITSVYFDSDTEQLNEAGRRKLYAVMTQSPEQFRTVYVVESANPQAQQRRVESIRRTTQELFAGQPTPEVVGVKIEPRSWSAEYLNAIDRKAATAIPAPVLPEFIDTTN